MRHAQQGLNANRVFGSYLNRSKPILAIREDWSVATLVQLAGYVREVFGSQPDRRFVPSEGLMIQIRMRHTTVSGHGRTKSKRERMGVAGHREKGWLLGFRILGHLATDFLMI
jgi:hypothetical protein